MGGQKDIRSGKAEFRRNEKLGIPILHASISKQMMSRMWKLAFAEL